MSLSIKSNAFAGTPIKICCKVRRDILGIFSNKFDPYPALTEIISIKIYLFINNLNKINEYQYLLNFGVKPCGVGGGKVAIILST